MLLVLWFVANKKLLIESLTTILSEAKLPTFSISKASNSSRIVARIVTGSKGDDFEFRTSNLKLLT